MIKVEEQDFGFVDPIMAEFDCQVEKRNGVRHASISLLLAAILMNENISDEDVAYLMFDAAEIRKKLKGNQQ